MNATAQAINQETRLDELVDGLKHSKRYSVGPCPFCGGRDRFNIKHTDEGDLWICRQCGDGKYQDAVAFLMRFGGLSFAAVIGQHDAKTDTSQIRPLTAYDPAHLPNLERPPSEDWQSQALLAVGKAADYLHHSDKEDARAAWSYLRKYRGLLPDTLFDATIGFNPSWTQVSEENWLAPGITIPAIIDGQLWYVQVRTTKAARRDAQARGRSLAKYQALAGSRLKALFNADALLLANMTIVTEGEFDALLLGQFLPNGVVAVSMGGAGTLPGPVFLRYFAAVERVFLIMDADEAGQAGLARWQQLLSWADAAPPLPGIATDITDSWRAGEDLTIWVQSFLGYPQPPHAQAEETNHV